MIARNRPYDEFVRGIVAAAGEWQDAPAINWHWQSRDDQLHQVDGRHGPDLSRPAPAMRQVPSPSLRALGPGRLLRAGRLLPRLGRKGFGEPPPYYAAAARHHGREKPAHRQAARAEVPRRPGAEVRSGGGPAAQAGGLDGPARQSVLRQGPGQSACGAISWAAGSSSRWTTCAKPIRRATPSCSTHWRRTSSAHKFDVKHVIRTISTSGPISSARADRAQQARPTEPRPLLRPPADRPRSCSTRSIR